MRWSCCIMIPDNVRQAFNDVPSEVSKTLPVKQKGQIKGRSIIVVLNKHGDAKLPEDNKVSIGKRIQAYFGFGRASFANVLHAFQKQDFTGFTKEQLTNLHEKAKSYDKNRWLSGTQRKKVSDAMSSITTKLKNLQRETCNSKLQPLLKTGPGDESQKGKSDIQPQENNVPSEQPIQEQSTDKWPPSLKTDSGDRSQKGKSDIRPQGNNVPSEQPIQEQSTDKLQPSLKIGSGDGSQKGKSDIQPQENNVPSEQPIQEQSTDKLHPSSQNPSVTTHNKNVKIPTTDTQKVPVRYEYNPTKTSAEQLRALDRCIDIMNDYENKYGEEDKLHARNLARQIIENRTPEELLAPPRKDSMKLIDRIQDPELAKIAWAKLNKEQIAEYVQEEMFWVGRSNAKVIKVIVDRMQEEQVNLGTVAHNQRGQTILMEMMFANNVDADACEYIIDKMNPQNLLPMNSNGENVLEMLLVPTKPYWREKHQKIIEKLIQKMPLQGLVGLASKVKEFTQTSSGQNDELLKLLMSKITARVGVLKGERIHTSAEKTRTENIKNVLQPALDGSGRSEFSRAVDHLSYCVVAQRRREFEQIVLRMVDTLSPDQLSSYRDDMGNIMHLAAISGSGAVLDKIFDKIGSPKNLLLLGEQGLGKQIPLQMAMGALARFNVKEACVRKLIDVTPYEYLNNRDIQRNSTLATLFQEILHFSKQNIWNETADQCVEKARPEEIEAVKALIDRLQPKDLLGNHGVHNSWPFLPWIVVIGRQNISKIEDVVIKKLEGLPEQKDEEGLLTGMLWAGFVEEYPEIGKVLQEKGYLKIVKESN